MENSREEQVEALKVLADFQDKLLANAEILMDELKTSKKDDTDKLLKSVTDAVNWEIGVLNGTLSLINEKEVKLEKEDINSSIMALAEALRTEEDKIIAESLEKNLLPMLHEDVALKILYTIYRLFLSRIKLYIVCSSLRATSP